MTKTKNTKRYFAGVFLKKSIPTTITTNTNIGTFSISNRGSSMTMYAMSKRAKGVKLVFCKVGEYFICALLCRI